MQAKVVAVAVFWVLSGCGQQTPVRVAVSPASTKQVTTAQAIKPNPCVDSGQSAEFCGCVTKAQTALADDVKDGTTLDARTQKSLADCATLIKPEDATVDAKIEQEGPRQRDLAR